MRNNRHSTAIFAAIGCLLSVPAYAQHDPGVRGGFANTAGELERRGIPIPEPPLISPNPGTGAPVQPNEKISFVEGILRAGQLESTCESCNQVTGGDPVIGLGELDPIFPQFHTNSNGLGARHNADQCFLCHAQPTLGGSGGFLVPNPGQGTPMRSENPLFRLVPRRFGKQNITPAFEQQFGPIREARFKFNPDGTRDGSVHQLFTVRGIKTDPGIPDCAIIQPDFAAEQAKNNLSFRIPLQMFGTGLIDSIQDREIRRNQAATAALRKPLGIGGHPNLSANDGTITRFGWKAQNKSITVFAGEAYNVEMGISNELFPTDLEEDPACSVLNQEPNDTLRTDKMDGVKHEEAFNNPREILPDWMQFQLLMRFMADPQPDPHPSASAIRGRVVFNDTGCSLCHTPQMQTHTQMNSAVLQNRPVNLFSDLLVHHMGGGLADDIIQGAAGPDEFRTVPLWGVGQRLFFLHDGRTNDLLVAIKDHFSPKTAAFPASEANAVVTKFVSLPPADQQAILDFLRSL